jgi:mannobiose 2-epimerase
MWDRRHGGYFWQVAADGGVEVDRKQVYGQAFAIYALVELYRASGDRAPLERALELFRLVQARAHDGAHGGWFEDCAASWTRLTDPTVAGRLVEAVGHKSANSTLHVMEAYAELGDATGDRAVLAALSEAVRLTRERCFPSPEDAWPDFADDWRRVGLAGYSPGHNVEFAWLLLRAEEVLGRPTSRDLFIRFIDHAVGISDRERGGLPEAPPSRNAKVWWVQAEFLAALAEGLGRDPSRQDWADALALTVRFVRTKMADPVDGVWMAQTTADGAPVIRTKAGPWKANYHDLRALVKVVRTLEAAP